MDQQLREALLKGKEDHENRSVSEAEKTRMEAEARVQQAREREAEWRRRIREEPALLFQKIREAVAKGKDEIDIIFGDEWLVNVLREIEGLEVRWASGEKHINSDEVKEPYFDINVKWKKLP